MAGEYVFLNKFNVTPRDKLYPTSTVTVDIGGGGDYTSIKAAIDGVSPSVTDPIKIFVKEGTYNEIQMDGKDYLTIEGESMDGVIIISDGLREDVDPVSGERYVDMAEADKHGFFIHHDMKLQNLTIRANDVKYCIHTDSSGEWTFYLYNVKLQHTNGFPFGVGSHENQGIQIDNCIFEEIGISETTYGIFWHNWHDRTAPTWMTVNNSQFINLGICYLFELGSDFTDLCKFVNCETDDTKGFKFVVTNLYYDGGSEPPVTDVPYCINLLTIGGTFPTPILYSTDDRPNLLDHVSIE